jgi:hypothetical protein
MELLAIASIIGYGLYNSQQGTPRSDRNTYAEIMGSGNGVKDEYDIKPTDMVRKYRKKAENRWKQAQVPKESGIITPNMRPSEVMPFFTSGKTMNTNTDYKQRKMELFTGEMLDGFSTSGTYKHKQESGAMFGATPQGVVTSSGTVGNPAGNEELAKARSISTRTQKNILPAEQLRVGPGLGVGPEVAATGGFQQFYRQLPLNVGAYKKTTLPGRVVPGGTQVGGKGELQQLSAVNHNPGLVMPYEDRPPLATPNGALLAHTQYGNEPRGCAGLRPFESGYEGIAESLVQAPQSRYLDKTRGRMRTNDDDTLPVTNLSGQHMGVGGYVNDPMESVTLESQRGLINRYLSPAGPTGVNISAGEVRPTYATETTLRQTYEDVYYTGGAASTVGATERLDVMELQPHLRTAKRAGQERAYTPGAGRMNVYEPDTMGGYGLIEKVRYDGIDHALVAQAVPTFGSIATEGKNERFGTKSTVENPHSSARALNLAEEQLSNNIFNLDITKDADSFKEVAPGFPYRPMQVKPPPANAADDLAPLWKKKSKKSKK